MTYQVQIVTNENHVFDVGAPCSSLEECTALVAQTEEAATNLQECCDALPVDLARRVYAAAPAAVRHFEGCTPHVQACDGKRYVLADEATWELLP
jgi:hypothetical protein